VIESHTALRGTQRKVLCPSSGREALLEGYSCNFSYTATSELPLGIYSGNAVLSKGIGMMSWLPSRGGVRLDELSA